MSVHSSRDRTVQSMFDRISGRYDLLNRVISFRLDAAWRHRVIQTVLNTAEPRILDIGTGTGDLVLNAAKVSHGNGKFVGLDFSLQMLRLAHVKRTESMHASESVFVMGSAMAMPFKSNIFDGSMSAFVLRNVSDLGLLFSEAYRVLKPGGKFVSLDMFPPPAGWFSPFYSLYFHCFMPRIGGLLAKDRAAYQYLSESVRQFHPPEKVAAMIEDAGFQQVAVQKFLNGAVCMHIGNKASTPLPRS